jgi:hypothetical protein
MQAIHQRELIQEINYTPVDKILKVTSGSNEITGEKVNNLYKSVITAGYPFSTYHKSCRSSQGY